MPLVPQRSLRRYIVLLFIVAILLYYILFSRHSPSPSSSAADQLSSERPNLASEYIKPEQHGTGQLETVLQVDRALLQQREREARRRQIDLKYCGRDRCQFVLPVAITEQESKAQEHFRHLAFLSGALDRTIVLPNVHSSHLGACRHFPFSFYYDNAWLDNNRRFFRYMTMEDFRDWISERREIDTIPTSRELTIDINPNFKFLDNANNCFKDLLDYSSYPPTHFTLEDPEMFSKRVGNYTEMLLEAFQQNQEDVDVISLFYDRRFGYIEHPEVEIPLPYNNRWEQLADQIAEQLQPFVAIHWRMERLEALDNLVPCAESLVRKIHEIESIHQQPLKVFLLTDYPHLLRTSKATPESMSFKLNELQQQHHDAIQYLYEHVDVTVTTLQRKNQPVPYDELPAKNWNVITVPPYAKPADPSVLGIVDKLVAMRAQYFLAGEPGVCAKSSSFTKRIMLEREAAFNAGNPQIVVPVDTFSL
ncbi:hypothetical protein RO3G_11163 [Lichtheimia corymbifera JMRC:FSU:9682]|uniref:Proteophosphoglycan 5 n=1 Tax=Lichtheimia corymbifera JMRC:FSU:9682 TaxID=1263082 RepID=A0A068S4X7_9FUNG|nr:hypothetical protein RO3G_11163 [Lichtheimia corymbifera JMRC:FSU:9682]